MSQTNIAITQLVQLGFADRLAYESLESPEVFRQNMQQAIPEALKQQKEGVALTENSESPRALNPEKDGEGREAGSGKKRRQRKGAQPEDADPSSGTPSSGSPWAGNILNFKV